jgi:transaldolase
MSLDQIPIKLFADGADLKGITDYYHKPYIAGLTTNPSLMRKAGINDYEKFSREVLEIVRDKPISLEVFSDDIAEMRRQALKIQSWGKNVYVKIPITNTQGEPTAQLVADLANSGVQLNVTAIMTIAQVRAVVAALQPGTPSVISVFAGRVADTGVDPEPLMLNAKEIAAELPSAELLWASVREVFNIYQAARCGIPIVTVTHDILAKAAKMKGIRLEDLSLDTVRMFRDDAVSAGYSL